MAAAAEVLTRSQDTRARRLFTGFGTCDTAEPLADLAGLGLIPTPGPRPGLPTETA